jgi:hypothetical protein
VLDRAFLIWVKSPHRTRSTPPFWPTRLQDPIVLVLSPPWRTVLVLVIERVACMASTRLLLRLTNRRSLTRGSRSLSPFAYPLPNSCPIQRVDQDGMIQLLDRSSTSTASLSTSTKNSQNKTMHRSGRSAAVNFRNHFGGHSVMVAVRAICPSPFISSAALRQRKKTDPQHGLCSCKSWPRRHEADGGQEELDGRWVSLPSGSSRRRRNLQLQSMRSCLASVFVVLVLSPPRRSGTQ